MANALTGNPLVIDTADSTLANFPGVSITKIVWNAPTTIAHTFSIQDSAKELVAGVCAVANQGVVIDFFPPLRLKSGKWKVPTLSSGKLFVYSQGVVK